MNPRVVRYIDKGGAPTTSVLFYDMRTSFMNVFSPVLNNLSGLMEYSVDVLIPKGTDLSDLDATVADVIAEKWPQGRPDFRNPQPKDKFEDSLFLKDGDKKLNRDGEIYDGYAGMVYFTAKSAEDQPPRVVDMAKQVIENANEFQSGYYANFNIEIYGYGPKAGNAGIGFQLRSVMKTYEADTFRGGMAGEASVDAFDVDPDMAI